MNYPALENFLLRFQHFTPQQLQWIGSQAVERRFKAGAYFAEAGRVAQEIGFVVSGVFRVCYFDKDGNDITKYFIEEDNFVVDLQSYQHQLPSTEYVQAVTEAQVLIFTARTWQSFATTIVDWHKVESKLISRALLEKVRRLSPLVNENATTRYQHFLKEFPALANRIPLSYLASYIGVTQQSLSRIRRKFGEAGRAF